MGQYAWFGVLSGWLLIGGIVGVGLSRRGQPLAAVLTAVPCWPLYVAMLLEAAPGAGPYTARITTTFERLRAAFAEAGEEGGLDLRALEQSLFRADARLGRVDRLLAEGAGEGPGEEADATTAALRSARDRTALEIEGVLGELHRIRIQLGLVSLTSDAAPVRTRLLELAARARAFDEVEPCALVVDPIGATSARDAPKQGAATQDRGVSRW